MNFPYNLQPYAKVINRTPSHARLSFFLRLLMQEFYRIAYNEEEIARFHCVARVA